MLWRPTYVQGLAATLVDLHIITFSNSYDPNKDILERKSILVVKVLYFLNKPLFLALANRLLIGTQLVLKKLILNGDFLYFPVFSVHMCGCSTGKIIP